MVMVLCFMLLLLLGNYGFGLNGDFAQARMAAAALRAEPGQGSQVAGRLLFKRINGACKPAMASRFDNNLLHGNRHGCVPGRSRLLDDSDVKIFGNKKGHLLKCYRRQPPKPVLQPGCLDAPRFLNPDYNPAVVGRIFIAYGLKISHCKQPHNPCPQ